MSKRTLSVAPPAVLPADYPRSAISETVSGKFGLAELAKVFTLPWSAYVLLISVKDACGPVPGIPSCRLRLSRRCHDNLAGSSLPSRCYTGDWKNMPVPGIVWMSK